MIRFNNVLLSNNNNNNNTNTNNTNNTNNNIAKLEIIDLVRDGRSDGLFTDEFVEFVDGIDMSRAAKYRVVRDMVRWAELFETMNVTNEEGAQLIFEECHWPLSADLDSLMTVVVNSDFLCDTYASAWIDSNNQSDLFLAMHTSAGFDYPEVDYSALPKEWAILIASEYSDSDDVSVPVYLATYKLDGQKCSVELFDKVRKDEAQVSVLSSIINGYVEDEEVLLACLLFGKAVKRLRLYDAHITKRDAKNYLSSVRSGGRYIFFYEDWFARKSIAGLDDRLREMIGTMHTPSYMRWFTNVSNNPARLEQLFKVRTRQFHGETQTFTYAEDFLEYYDTEDIIGDDIMMPIGRVAALIEQGKYDQSYHDDFEEYGHIDLSFGHTIDHDTFGVMHTVKDFYDEGREMRHCASTYAAQAAHESGKYIMAHVHHNDEHATVWINTESWYIDEIYCPFNRPVSDEMRQHVNDVIQK